MKLQIRSIHFLVQLLRIYSISNRSRLYAIMMVTLDWFQINYDWTPLSNPVWVWSPVSRSRENPTVRIFPARCLGDLITSGHFRAFIGEGPATSDLDPIQIRMTLTPTPDSSAKPATQQQFRNSRNGKVFLYRSAICGVFLPRLETWYRLNNWCATGQFKHFRTARGYRWSFQNKWWVYSLVSEQKDHMSGQIQWNPSPYRQNITTRGMRPPRSLKVSEIKIDFS